MRASRLTEENTSSKIIDSIALIKSQNQIIIQLKELDYT